MNADNNNEGQTFDDSSWLEWNKKHPDHTSRVNYTTIGEFDYGAHTLSDRRKSWSIKDFNVTTRQKIEQFYDQHKLMYKKRAEFFKKSMQNQTMESLKGFGNFTGDTTALFDEESIDETV